MSIFKNYYLPTPVKWRKIGDAILLVGVTIDSVIMKDYDKYKEAFGNDLKFWLIGIVVCAVVGKLGTNLKTAQKKY